MLHKTYNDEEFLSEPKNPFSPLSPVALILDLNLPNQENISCNLDKLLTPETSSFISQEPSISQIQSNSRITPQAFENLSLKDYLHSFVGRRNSDSTLVVNPSASSRISLFHEIKRLTDYLFKIKAQESRKDINQHQVDRKKEAEEEIHQQNQQPVAEEQKEENEIAVESKPSESNHKTLEQEQMEKKVELEMNLKNSGHKQNYDSNNENVTTDSVEEETGNLTPSAKGRNITELFKKLTNKKEEEKISNAPWVVSNKRTKFKVNQMSSRDVPIFKTGNNFKLQKQNAIITSETLFQEKIIKPVSQQSSLDSTDVFKKFQQETNTLFQQHHKHHQNMMKRSQQFFQEPHSISFELGTFNMDRTLEQRALNSIATFFQLHARNGTTVKQIQKQIESKSK